MSGPFNEYEKRFLLGEIIKTSKVPIDALLRIIKDEHIEPAWNEMYFPAARSVNACAAALQDLLKGPPAPPQHATGFEPANAPSLKRRYSDTEQAAPMTRTLYPKSVVNGAQVASLRSPAEPSAKKRGRPSKEVLEARKQDAALRGNPYPPLQAAGRKSLGASPSDVMSFGPEGAALGSGQQTAISVDPQPKKRRGRPPKEEADMKMMQQSPGAVHQEVIHQKALVPAGKEVPLPVAPEPKVIDSFQQDVALAKSKEPEIPDSAETNQTYTLQQESQTQPPPPPPGQS